MFLPEMHSWRQTNNSLLEGTLRLVEKHDRSQSKYPAVIGENRECGSSIFHSSFPSSYCVCQSQNALIDENMYEGDCGPSAYDHSLNAGNVMPNSFAIPHEINYGETENNTTELNPGAFCNEWNLRKQDETIVFNPDDGDKTFLDNQDLMGDMADISTVVNGKVNRESRKAEMVAEIPAGRAEHSGFRISSTARDSKGSGTDRASGSKDRHTKVLTSKGPRDRRIRLSVGTAVKLFCVQERLGFDQPSKAVEWLIENSQAAVRELIQLSSFSSSHNSQYADSNRAAVSLSCHQSGDLKNLPQENTARGDCFLNLCKQILTAETCVGQKCSTATTTESNNRDSIVYGEKREPRSMAKSSVVSNRITRERANAFRRKEFRAKARERARERMKQKEKCSNQNAAMYGTLQPFSLYPQYPKFCLQDDATSVSYFNTMSETIGGNMMNETIDSNSYNDGFLHSLMFPKGSIMCNHSRLSISSPPAEIQCSSLPNVHISTAQQEGISIQSTALSGLDPEAFSLSSDPFHPAVAKTHNGSSYGRFCRSLDLPHVISSNLYGSCTEGIPGTCESGLETLYETQSSLNTEIFQDFQINEEISGLQPAKECVPLRRILTSPSAYIGISCFL